MWVSGKEFRELKEQVAELKHLHESHVVDVMEFRNFTVYDLKEIDKRNKIMLYLPYFSPIPQRRISLKDVVSLILDKLNLELVYVEGIPTKVEMKKKAQT